MTLDTVQLAVIHLTNSVRCDISSKLQVRPKIGYPRESGPEDDKDFTPLFWRQIGEHLYSVTQ